MSEKLHTFRKINKFSSNCINHCITSIVDIILTGKLLNLQQGPPKGTTTSSRGRGRPKKTEEKPELTGEDEDEQEEEEEEEEN